VGVFFCPQQIKQPEGLHSFSSLILQKNVLPPLAFRGDAQKVWITNTRIDSRLNRNNDGFDLDSCRDVFIRDCHLHTGDDAICLKSTRSLPAENFVISGCLISSDTAGVKLGTSSSGGFRNILVQDCIFSRCRMGVIKLLCVDGGVLENVHFSNLIMEDVEGPVFVRLGRRGVVFDRPKEIVYDRADVKGDNGPAAGILRNCSFRNIQASVRTTNRANANIMITGVPGACIENLQFENIDISLPGGGTSADAARTVPEDERRYPEQFFFGVLPSAAVFIRHARKISFTNARFTLEQADSRPLFHSSNVSDLSIKDCFFRIAPTEKFKEIKLAGS